MRFIRTREKSLTGPEFPYLRRIVFLPDPDIPVGICS